MAYMRQLPLWYLDNMNPDDAPAVAPNLADLAPEVASTVVRVAGDIALVIGEDGVISSVADGSLPLSGAGWVGRLWADTVAEPARRKVLLLLQEARQHGLSRRRELNHPANEGGEIPVSWAAVRLGEHGPLLAVGRDLRAVSAIQQRFLDAQKDLERDYWQRRNAESHYRLLFQVAHDAVLVLDADDGRVLEANPSAGPLFGQPSPSWAGLPLRGYIEEDLRPGLDELLLTARTTGRATELRLRTAASGTTLDVSATPFHSEGRHCLLLRARRVDASAGDTPGVLDFIGQTPDAVVVTDMAARVLWANPAFVDMCQAPDELRLKGHRLDDLLGDPQQQWTALLARVRARGVVGRATVQIRVAGHTGQAVDVSAALLDESDQERIGFTLRHLGSAPRGLAPAVPPPDELALDLAGLVPQLGSAALPEMLAEASRRVELHFVRAALRAAGGHIDIAAGALRIGTDALLQRMERLGVPLPQPVGHEGLPPTVN